MPTGLTVIADGWIYNYRFSNLFDHHFLIIIFIDTGTVSFKRVTPPSSRSFNICTIYFYFHLHCPYYYYPFRLLWVLSSYFITVIVIHSESFLLVTALDIALKHIAKYRRYWGYRFFRGLSGCFSIYLLRFGFPFGILVLIIIIYLFVVLFLFALQST